MARLFFLITTGVLWIIAAPVAMTGEPAPAHEHKMVQMPDNVLEPHLRLALTRDKKSGFNLQILTENFQLEPPELAGDHPENILEGHAHIYINGKKTYRAYGKYIHLPESLFGDGIQQIMMSLNDHDHNTWSKGSRMVMSTLAIDPEKQEFIVHAFNTF